MIVVQVSVGKKDMLCTLPPTPLLATYLILNAEKWTVGYYIYTTSCVSDVYHAMLHQQKVASGSRPFLTTD